MKYQTNTLYTTVTGGTFASIAFLLGGIDKLVVALAIIMAIDFITGIATSMGKNAEEKTNSKRAFQGLVKKGAMISLVIVANQLDMVAGSESGFMRNAMIFFLIGTEGISILENMNRLGVPFPAFLAQRFEQMVQHNDKGKSDKQ